MSKKVYSVTVARVLPGTVMVRADSHNQAVRHVAAKCIESKLLSADEALVLMGDGVKIETAGDSETAALPLE